MAYPTCHRENAALGCDSQSFGASRSPTHRETTLLVGFLDRRLPATGARTNLVDQGDLFSSANLADVLHEFEDHLERAAHMGFGVSGKRAFRRCLPLS